MSLNSLVARGSGSDAKRIYRHIRRRITYTGKHILLLIACDSGLVVLEKTAIAACALNVGGARWEQRVLRFIQRVVFGENAGALPVLMPPVAGIPHFNCYSHLNLVTAGLDDPRNALLIKHNIVDMLRQRVYALTLGWEDLNDHSALCNDVAMQTAVGADETIASAPTLCRVEKWADRSSAVRLHQVLVDQFIASVTTAPNELVLDFDATHNPLFGRQEGLFFHGYYDAYCYFPLYVFCGQQLLCV